jgi:hypothetical protein
MADVWVFHGANASLSAGVFSTRAYAENWIAHNKLTGMLTRYPLDTSIYDWAVKQGYWKPTRDDQSTAEFKQRFTSASLEHFHYEDGCLC